MDVVIYLFAAAGAYLLWWRFRGGPRGRNWRFTDPQGPTLEIALSAPWGEVPSPAAGTFTLKNHRDGTLLHLMPIETLGSAKAAMEMILVLERAAGFRVPDTVNALPLRMASGEGYYHRVAWDDGSRIAGVATTARNTVMFHIIVRDAAAGSAQEALKALCVMRPVR
jgi:hypothetical protein